MGGVASTNRAVVTRAREAAPIPATSASRPTCLTCSGRLGGAAAAGRRRQFFLAELLLADSAADDGARAIGADADRLRLVGAAAMVPAPIERSQLPGHRQQIGKSAALTVAALALALSALRPLRLRKISGIWQRQPIVLWSRARANNRGTRRLLTNRPGSSFSTKSPIPKERLRVSNWIVQRLV